VKVNVQVQDVIAYPGDALIVNLFDGVRKPGGATRAVDEALGGLISQVIAQREFEGKAGSSVLLHTQGKLRAEGARHRSGKAGRVRTRISPRCQRGSIEGPSPPWV